MRLSLTLTLLIASVSLATAGTAAAQVASRFHDWTSVIIAGDWRTSRGQPIEAFDNSVRDLSAGFEALGFPRTSMVAVSLRPDAQHPVTADDALARIGNAASTATGGCLLYFTSHGSQRGMVFGPDQIMTPSRLEALVDSWCGVRPTIVIVSACYSGIFTSALAEPNRIVVTAARRDRASFGCSEEATYPYFDGCLLQSLPVATDFIDLAQRARKCVSEREAAEVLSPPSEPQLAIGAEMQLRGPTLRFLHPAQ